jgi:DHA1 family bicyclomycin/chloramphenicol resistance-like MFS transporter
MQITMRRVVESNKRISTILAFALIPLSGFALDVYIPSLPDMAAKLHTSPGAVQLTISVYLIAYGICQLLIGSLLDSYGRYLPCLAGLLLFGVSSFVIANSESLEIIYLMRAVQGIMVAVIVVSKRASIFDLYSGEKLKYYTSLFSIVWSSAPIIAPFLGGYLQTHFGWQSNFYFLGYFAIFLFLMELFLSGETLLNKSPFNFKEVNQAYISMIKTKDFMLGIFVLGLVYGMMLVYNMASPFLIEGVMHYSPEVTGNASLLSGVAVLCGGLLAKRNINRPLFRKIAIAAGLQTLAAIGLAIFTFYTSNLYTLLAYVLILHMAVGFIFNTMFSYVLTRFSANAGKVGGLAGGAYVIVTSSFSYGVVGLLSISSQVWLGVSYSILAFCSLLIIVGTKWKGDSALAH